MKSINLEIQPNVSIPIAAYRLLLENFTDRTLKVEIKSLKNEKWVAVVLNANP